MMNRRRLGGKDIHLDANSLRVLWKVDAGGGLFPQFVITHGHTNVTDGTDNANWSGASVKMDDLKNINCQGAFIIPAGYAGETITIEALAAVNSVVNANLYLYADVSYKPVGDATTTTDFYNGGAFFTLNPSTEGWDVGDWYAIASITLSTPAAGDLVFPYFQRDASHVNDTYGTHMRFLGWRITWT